MKVVDDERVSNQCLIIIDKVKALQIKHSGSDFALDVNKKLLGGHPHVEFAIENGFFSKYKIISLVRSRVNFFTIYNLFDW